MAELLLSITIGFRRLISINIDYHHHALFHSLFPLSCLYSPSTSELISPTAVVRSGCDLVHSMSSHLSCNPVSTTQAVIHRRIGLVTLTDADYVWHGTFRTCPKTTARSSSSDLYFQMKYGCQKHTHPILLRELIPTCCLSASRVHFYTKLPTRL
jgi:hypothetical protein